MKVKELQPKTEAELLAELANLSKSLFNIRFSKVVDSSNVSLHKLKFLRKGIARIKTILSTRGVKV